MPLHTWAIPCWTKLFALFVTITQSISDTLSHFFGISTKICEIKFVRGIVFRENERCRLRILVSTNFGIDEEPFQTPFLSGFDRSYWPKFWQDRTHYSELRQAIPFQEWSFHFSCLPPESQLFCPEHSLTILKRKEESHVCKTTYSNADPSITAIMSTGVSGENSPDPKEGSLSQGKHSTVTVTQFEAPAVNGANGRIVQANTDPNPKIKCSIRFCPMLHEKLMTC